MSRLFSRDVDVILKIKQALFIPLKSKNETLMTHGYKSSTHYSWFRTITIGLP